MSESVSGSGQEEHERGNPRITADLIAQAEQLAGLEFTSSERELMLPGINQNLDQYDQLRTVHLGNDVPPVWRFDPQLPPQQTPAAKARRPPVISPSILPPVPDNLEELAFYPVAHLAQLLRTRQITSLQLTEMYLARLKRIGPKLECVVTLTEDLARIQAQRADDEIIAGVYRGPLHGIPWGAKDLLATSGIPTTWGAPPFKNQVIDMDATVVERLNNAGAVLVAKLSMGSLAWGDVWFGGKTRSPWNLAEGSSGSSAGSGAATAAGLVGFSIGTETYGSIVSPCNECGVSGLRPTFGRVSRHGAMALCWTLDKIGPMCRTVEDCALVFDVIQGSDGKDWTVTDQPFDWPQHVDLGELRIGYVRADFELERETKSQDESTLETLRSLGASLIPIELPSYPLDAMQIILRVEAAAAFDELTRTDQDDQLVCQGEESWPNRFRVARTVPAVEYIQADRIRTLVMREMGKILSEIDVYVAPALAGANPWLTNATGHPAAVIPNGFRENGLPSAITFTGRLYEESTLLAVVKVVQDATSFHLQHPDLSGE